MNYITLGSDSISDLAAVLLVLNVIALGVFVFTLGIDRILRGVDRVVNVLHDVGWLHRTR